MGWIRDFFGIRHHGNEEYGKYGRFYVYELLDPRTEPPRVFYVGSGVDNRMYDHAAEARRLVKQPMLMKCKHKRILEIFDAGYGTIPTRVVFRADWHWQALEVESEYIRRFGIERLTNDTFGWSKRAIAVEKCVEEAGGRTLEDKSQDRKRCKEGV